MRRSERLFRNAIHEALMALLFLLATCAASAWAVATLQSENVPGGAALVAGAVAALFFTGVHFRECIRLFRLSEREEQCEWERGIRPRV